MSIIASLVGPVSGILDKFVEDKDQKAALAHEIATMSDRHAQQALLAQLEINKAEAASGSLFKGGWRPAGWDGCALWRLHITICFSLSWFLFLRLLALIYLNSLASICLRSSLSWEDF